MRLVRHRRRRNPIPNPHRRRRHYRRNPAVLGIDLKDALSVAGGVYGTKNLGAALTGFVPGVKQAIDGVRPGLGYAAAELISAIGLGWLVGKWDRRAGSMVTLGGGAEVLSSTVTAVTPGVKLISGQPALGQVEPLSLMAPKPKPASNGNGSGSAAPQRQLATVRTGGF